MTGFETAMEEQKERARAAWKGSGEAADETIWFEIADRVGASEFLGYDTEEAEGQIVALVANGAEQDRPVTEADGEVAIILNQTPFYAEAGGQVGDTGVIRTATGRARVTGTERRAGSIHIHRARVEEGKI